MGLPFYGWRIVDGRFLLQGAMPVHAEIVDVLEDGGHKGKRGKEEERVHDIGSDCFHGLNPHSHCGFIQVSFGGGSLFRRRFFNYFITDFIFFFSAWCFIMFIDISNFIF